MNVWAYARAVHRYLCISSDPLSIQEESKNGKEKVRVNATTYSDEWLRLAGSTKEKDDRLIEQINRLQERTNERASERSEVNEPLKTTYVCLCVVRRFPRNLSAKVYAIAK